MTPALRHQLNACDVKRVAARIQRPCDSDRLHFILLCLILIVDLIHTGSSFEHVLATVFRNRAGESLGGRLLRLAGLARILRIRIDRITWLLIGRLLPLISGTVGWWYRL